MSRMPPARISILLAARHRLIIPSHNINYVGSPGLAPGFSLQPVEYLWLTQFHMPDWALASRREYKRRCDGAIYLISVDQKLPA